jgi:two-component system cell cycle sensor histidine kinase/response regulator CckA
MHDGGELRVAVRPEVVGGPPGNGERRPAPGAYAAIVVTDTGAGMDEATSARVFEPFFTTKPLGRGTGLGLPMVYGLVQQLRGAVTIESRVGGGTTATVLLPLATERAERAPSVSSVSSAPPPARPPGGTERVLLVEDDTTLRRIATRALERGGYRVTAVANGRDALRAIERLDAPPDLVMSDVVMPQMGGPELLRALHARGLEPKVLFTSGYQAADASARRQVDAEHPFIAKPWHIHDLLRLVRQVLDTPAPSPARR